MINHEHKGHVTQLKTLEVIMYDSLLVHYILYILPHQYAHFKIAYPCVFNKRKGC